MWIFNYNKSTKCFKNLITNISERTDLHKNSYSSRRAVAADDSWNTSDRSEKNTGDRDVARRIVRWTTDTNDAMEHRRSSTEGLQLSHGPWSGKCTNFARVFPIRGSMHSDCQQDWSLTRDVLSREAENEEERKKKKRRKGETKKKEKEKRKRGITEQYPEQITATKRWRTCRWGTHETHDVE